MAIDRITVRGARQHNLKNINVEIPRNRFTVITGLSGSGKSSLAFDTIYAEGQRRYVESLSAYARQFLDQLEKPDVDSVDGLSPAISIEQKTVSRSPRSTVGTVTEIYDYMRLLFSSIGLPHCYVCGAPITRQSVEQIVQSVLALPEGERVMILAPIVRGRKGEFRKELEKLATDGFLRARVDGELLSLDEEIKLDKRRNHTIEAVVDRLLIKPGINERLTESVRTALKLTGGAVLVSVVDGEEKLYSTCRPSSRVPSRSIQPTARANAVMDWARCSKSIRPRSFPTPTQPPTNWTLWARPIARAQPICAAR